MQIQGAPPPRAAVFRKTAPPGVHPDRVTLGSPDEPSEPEMKPPPPPPVKRSWVGRLLRWTGLAAMGATAGLGALGGIAYQANKDVLREPPSVYVYPVSLPSESPAAPALTTPPAADPAPSATPQKDAPVQAAPLQLKVPAQTIQAYLNQLQDSPQIRQMLVERTEEARQQVNQEIGKVQVPPGKVLVDLKLPLPTGQRSLLQVGKTDLPSLGYRALQTESVPLTVEYAVDPIQTDLQADIRTVPAEAGLQGPGILLGAVEVTVRAPEGKIPLSGTVRIHDDLGGEDTRAEIARLRAQGGQDRLIAQLEARLERGQRLQGFGQEQGFASLLRSTSTQGLKYQAEVKTGQAPLLKTTLYLWASPDQDGDGRADLQITQVNQLDRLEKIEVEVAHLEGEGARPDGFIAGLVHKKAQEALLKNLRQAVPELTGQLQATARDRTAEQLETARAQLQTQANGELQKIYRDHGRIDLPGGGPVAPSRIDVGKVQVTPGGLLVELDNASGLPGAGVESVALQPGQFAVGVNLDLLNRQLADPAQVDWATLLPQAAEKAGLKSLEFGQDAAGRTVYPELLVKDGKVALRCDLSATLAGAKTPLRTKMVLPLKLQTEGGKLVAGLDVTGVEFQKVQAKTGFDLSSLVPNKLLPTLFEKALGPKAQEKVDVNLADSLGIRFDAVRVGSSNSVTLVLRAQPVSK